MIKDSNPNEMQKLSDLNAIRKGILRTSREGINLSVFVIDEGFDPDCIFKICSDPSVGSVDLIKKYDKKKNKTYLIIRDSRLSNLLNINYFVEIGEIDGNNDYEISTLALKKLDIISEDITEMDVYKTIKKFLGFPIQKWFDPKYAVFHISGRLSSFIHFKQPNGIIIEHDANNLLMNIFAARNLINIGVLNEPYIIEENGIYTKWIYKVIRIPKEDEIGIMHSSNMISNELGINSNLKYIRHKMSLYLNCDGFCQLCGQWYPFHGTTVDHIIPQCDPTGNDDIKNLQIACNSCNQKKGKMSMMEFKKVFNIQQLREDGKEIRKQLIYERDKKREEDKINIINELKDIRKLFYS